MRRSPLKRKSKTPVAKLKVKLWELCKQLIRKRDDNVCFICGKGDLAGASWHTGHFLPSAACGAYLRYDLRNLHSSCYHCNINLGGNGAMFYVRLEATYGKKWLDKVFLDKRVIVKADEIFYLKLIEEYTTLLEKTQKQLQAHTKQL